MSAQKAAAPSTTLTRKKLIDLLNEDLSREFQAIIAYVNYSQVLKGAAYMNIAAELAVHATEELAHPCPPMGSPSSSRRPVADVFTVLVRTHTRLVRLAAWQAGAPERDLADVAQEVFLRLSHAIDRGLDTSAPVDGWLCRTTYTVTRDRLKLARYAREEVSATGEVGVDLELECVDCARKFAYPLRVEDFATQIELGRLETVDFTDQLREDILLALPPYPHCDWNGESVCKGAVLKGVNSPDEDPGESHTWDALDQLKFKTKKSHGSP